MRIKKSDLYFYEMLRNFLYKYLVVRRKFSPVTVKNYTDSLDQYRQYLRDQKGIPFDKVGFHCFTKEMIYGFCVWLRDSQKKAVNTINLRLSAIRSFLCYCSEEDVALSELYLKAKSIHRFKGKIDPKLEYLTPDQLETVFAAPDTKTWNGRRNQYFMIHAYETGGRVEEQLYVLGRVKNIALRSIMSRHTAIKFQQFVGKHIMIVRTVNSGFSLSAIQFRYS